MMEIIQVPKRLWKRKKKPDQDTFEVCAKAAEMLKSAGFALAFTSQKSEACYYQWQDWPYLIRVAAHGNDPAANGMPMKVIARATFTATNLTDPAHIRISDNAIEHRVAQAIGTYFIRAARDATNVT